MPAETFNEELFDAMLRHQTGILRFSGGLRNRVWELLDATEADVKRQIAGAGAMGFESPARLRRLEKLLRGLKETRLRGWKNVDALWFSELEEFARSEVGFFDRTIIASVPAVELGTVLPDSSTINQIVRSKPFMGKTLREWSKNAQTADIGRIEDQVKIGLVQGETLPQISRRIVGTVAQKGRDGVTQVARRNAASIARTVTSGVASESRRHYAEANKDLAPQEVFTATLDSRTTPICRSLDGKIFDVGKGPQLPLHFGERSLYSPVIDGEVIGERPRRDFTEKQLLREYSDQQGFKAPRRRADLPRGTKGGYDAFAKKRMRELTGQAPAKLTYQKWLGGQSAAFQDDILGPTRGKLFRKGGLQLDRFVEADGSELTLAQLASRNTDAFLRAGLDPDAFR